MENVRRRSLDLRRRINELKDELRQLEASASLEVSEIAVTSAACGHDDVLGAIRRAAYAIASTSNATLCGFYDAPEGENGWFYSTTFIPQDLEYYLPEAGGMVQFYEHLASAGILSLLHQVWIHGHPLCDSDAVLCEARSLGLVSAGPDGRLTVEGIQVLIVLAHLYYLIARKPRPQTALRMLPAIADIFGIDPMTDVLDVSTDEAMARIIESGRLTEIAPNLQDRESLRAVLHELSSPTRRRMAQGEL